MSRTPAICGGAPAFPDGPPTWQPHVAAVDEALRESVARGDWNRYHGPASAALVERLQQLVGVEFVIPASSGTIAVELALRGVGVEPGDEVILAAYDFPGNFRAVEAIGATPVLVDIDPQTTCLDVEQAATAIGSRTKAIVASHLHGGLVDLPRLREIANAAGSVAIVEDACQAPGAIVFGKPAGAWGDVATFSFGGSKLLSAGRGGAIATARADVQQKIKVFGERGNLAFPLCELQATVLLPQLEHLVADNMRRLAAARTIATCCEAVAGLTPVCILSDVSEPAFYKLGIAYDGTALGGYTRAEFCAAAQAEGIALDAGFRGFAMRGGRRCRRFGDLPHARAAAHQTMLLHHPVLLQADAVVTRTAEVIAELADLFHRRAVKFAGLPHGDPQTDSA